MRISFGYELVYSCSQSTPMLLMLHTHPSRVNDLVRPDTLSAEPAVPLTLYQDIFGNTCTRLIAPQGFMRVTADGIIGDPGVPEPIDAAACEHRIEELPVDALTYLLGSRYCETEPLMAHAWRLFGHVTPGWSRVQSVCDFVHGHMTFGYQYARSTKTAWDAFNERRGVCRDFAHLAITMLRCLNIPARYCTGYLGDIGVPSTDSPMDFAGWLEAYIGGAWHTFDPRNNQRRIGRILVARGRDAADVAISTTFGANRLQTFRVWTDEIVSAAGSSSDWLAQQRRSA